MADKTYSGDTKDIKRLYKYGERLIEAKEKLQNVNEYQGIIDVAGKSSIKAKQLIAQLIPRFFKYFPEKSNDAVDAHLDLCEEDDIGVIITSF